MQQVEKTLATIKNVLKLAVKGKTLTTTTYLLPL